ncbi:MAG: hypothetical protein WA708_13885 [Acidobacteriaceae bacterium]
MLGPPQAHTGMLGEQVWPVACQLPKLGHGLVLMLDPAPGAIPTADRSDPR